MIYTYLLLAASLQGAWSHSWVEQLTLIASDGSFTGSPGYPRGFVPRSAPGFSDTTMVNLLPPNGRSSGLQILPDDHICRPSQQNPKQSSGFDRLSVPAGSLIALRYQENGHVSLPQNQAGKPPNRGTIYIYSTTDPSSTDTILSIHKVWTADGSGGDKRGRLLATQNFDDAQCHQVNSGQISQQRQKDFAHPTDQLQGEDLWCQNNIKIPDDADAKKPLTLYWVWDWPTAAGTPGFPDGKPEVYTTCMDVDIQDKTKAPVYKKESASGKQGLAKAIADDGKSNVAAVGIPSLMAVALAQTSANMAAATTVSDYVGSAPSTISEPSTSSGQSSSSPPVIPGLTTITLPSSPSTSSYSIMKSSATMSQGKTVTITATSKTVVIVTASTAPEAMSSEVASTSRTSSSASSSTMAQGSMPGSTSSSSSGSVGLLGGYKTLVVTQIATYALVPQASGVSLFALPSSDGTSTVAGSSSASASTSSSSGSMTSAASSSQPAMLVEQSTMSSSATPASFSAIPPTSVVISANGSSSNKASEPATGSVGEPSTSTMSSSSSMVQSPNLVPYVTEATSSTMIMSSGSSPTSLAPVSLSPSSMVSTVSYGSFSGFSKPSASLVEVSSASHTASTIASVPESSASKDAQSTTLSTSTMSASVSSTSPSKSSQVFQGVEIAASSASSVSPPSTTQSSVAAAPIVTTYSRMKRSQASLPSRILRFRNMRA